MSQVKVSRTLDLRGMYCPGPVLETAKAIKQVNIGDVIEVLATDPAAEPDLQAWAKRTGQEIVDIKKEGEVIRVLIRRVK
ncbi:MAG: sulfurtransferase TusA family protein [Sulfolobaceae archaeon]